MSIIFDIDDTLINHTQAEAEAAEKFGEIFSDRIPLYSPDSFSRVWRDVSRKHFQAFLEGKSTFEEQRLNRIRDIFHSPFLTDREAGGLFREYGQLYEESWRLYPDVVPFLDACRKRQIPLGIISDGAQLQQEKKLRITGIDGYFSFILTAESTGLKKPDPLLFTKGAELFTGNREPVYYIGDHPDKDAKGANNAGLLGIWLNRREIEGIFEPVVKSLSEISLERIINGEDYV